MNANITRISRGSYGEIITVAIGGTPAPASYARAKNIVAQAIAKKLLDAPYVDVDRKHRGSALSYDLYDFAPGVALVQRRYTVCTKYGNSPIKNYYIVRRRGGKITVENADANKARIAKLAKSDLPWGGVIAVITGRKTAKIKTAPRQTEFTVYKAVAVKDGRYFSIFDGKTEYRIGQLIREIAKHNHGGGYYCYGSAHEARRADVPRSSVLYEENRAILRCTASGRKIVYPGGKMAFSNLIPIEVVPPVVVDPDTNYDREHQNYNYVW